MKNENLSSFSFDAQVLVLTSRLKLDSSTFIVVPASAFGMEDISGYSTLPTKGPSDSIKWKDVKPSA